MSLDGVVATNDSFGEGLALARKEEWVDNYIDYGRVMDFLTAMKTRLDEEHSSHGLRRGHKSHASTFFLMDLHPPTTIGETQALVGSSSYDGASSGGGLKRRMSEGTVSLLNNTLHSDKKTSRVPPSPEEDRSPVRRPRGESWPTETDHSVKSSSSSVGPVKPDSDQAHFCSLLDEELEKVGLFFLFEQGQISNALRELVHEKDQVRVLLARSLGDHEEEIHAPKTATEKLIEGYRTVGLDLLELFHFVAINMTVLRKLLNRHDAIVRRFSDRPPLLRQWYVLSRTEDKQKYLRTFLSHNGLMAVEGTVRRGVADLIPSHFATNGDESKIDDPREAIWGGEHITEIDLNAWIGNIEAIAAKMKRAEKRSFKDFVVAGSVGNTLDFEPSILRDRFDPNMDQGDADMQFYVDWRKREEGRRKLQAEPGSVADIVWPFGLQLNLLSTFLYMTNYFIAGPTSVTYINALGGHDALASMVIGATPWAVMASTFLFSIWTNYSFRKPLIFSGVLLCFGNFLYASALKYDSIAILMAGRMLIGLGGPRLINRRYIADTATIEQRTAVSAAFVTFSASGTAVGPGLAVILQHVNVTFQVPVFGTIILNGLTAPGYFMLGLWLMFFFVMLFAFEEPTRMGLEQQKSFPSKLGRQRSIKKEDSSQPSERQVLVQSDSQRGQQRYDSGVEIEENAVVAEKMADDASVVDDESSAWCCMKITWPVVMCLMLLFVDKLAIESLISSAPIITNNRYDWTVHMIGALMVLIGLLVIPLSICIGWLSRRYEDGKLLLWLLYFTTIGLVLFLDVSQLGEMGQKLSEYGLLGVGPHRYVYGCLVSFSGLQAMESIIMSTLSKVVPYYLAVGTCNSGLLNTEIGTFGRAFGDLMVTFVGFASLENLLDLLVVPLLMLMIGCIVLVKLNYEIFAA